MRSFNVINLSKKHPDFILFLVSVFVAYSIGKFIIKHDPIETQLIIIAVLFLVITFRWNILLIPILFLSYSGYFGNFQNISRLPILVVPGGLTFYEVLIFFYLFYFFFIKKANILRTPIAKAILLLFISAIVSVIVTHFEYGSDLRSLLMNQRSIFLYLSFFIFLAIMNNSRSFYNSNYIMLALALVFTLQCILSNIFPDVREFRTYPIGGFSSEMSVAIQDFGARRFLFGSDGLVFCGLAFMFFLIVLNPFNKYRGYTYIFCLSSLTALLLSFTRGYWICILFSLVITTLYTKRKSSLYHAKFSSLSIILFLVFIAFNFLGSFDYLSIKSAAAIRAKSAIIELKEVSGTFKVRLLEAEAAMEQISRRPFFGSGNFIIRQYGPVVGPSPHFGFLAVYVNYGLLGFISFLLFVFIPIRQFIQNAPKLSNKTDFWIATSSICYILIFMTISFYSSQFFHNCWVISFSFCLANLAFLNQKYKDSSKQTQIREVI